MIGKISLLLALCAFSGVLCVSPPYYPPEVAIRTGAGNGAERPCSQECYMAIREWLMRQGCMVPRLNGAMMEMWIDVLFDNRRIETVRVTGACFGYQMCDKCGAYGQCIVDKYGLPICQCMKGHEGPNCWDKNKGDEDSMLIIVVVPVAGGLAFIIVVAVVVHLCRKRQHKVPKKISKVAPSSTPHVCAPVKPISTGVTITELDHNGKPKVDQYGMVQGIPTHGIFPQNCRQDNVYTTIPL